MLKSVSYSLKAKAIIKAHVELDSVSQEQEMSSLIFCLKSLKKISVQPMEGSAVVAF